VPTLPANNLSYWQLAKAHKFLILAFVLLGLVAGIVRVIVTTPMYSAVTTVEMVGFNQRFLGMNQVDPQIDSGAANVQTQIRILTSRSLLSRVSERLNLEMTPVPSTASAPPADPANETLEAKVFRNIASIREKIPFFQKDPLNQSRAALRDAFRKLSVKSVPLTRLIEISTQSPSPEVAANFVNTLAAEHVTQSLAARSGTTQKNSQWMESQLEETKGRLQDAGEKLRDFVQKSGMDFFPEQTTLADSKMRALQGDVAAVQADRINKQSRWELAQKTPLDSLPDVMNDGTLQVLKRQTETLRRQMAELTATLTPEHYKVKRLQAQLTETEETLEKEKAGLLKRVESDYEESLRREKLLLGAYNAQTHSVAAQSDKSAQYAMLKRDVDTQQQLYNTLLLETNEAALIALAPSSSIRVVDPAAPPSIPTDPKPFRDVPAGALIGAALGYAIVWWREKLRSKRFAVLFESPGHTRTILGVPELGVIPSAPFDQSKKKLLLGASGRALRMAAEASRLDFFSENSESIDGLSASSELRQSERSSLLSESFRQTLVSLLHTKPDGHNPVYVITSAGPGEGKTTLCANLARSMAEVGQRVLLVDADLRRPHVHSIFGSKDHEGLSEILASSTPTRDLDLRSYIQATQVEGLSVMTHGLLQSETPGRLFFSPRVGELVALLEPQFDCILLDTAPALPFPDARLWGRHSNGVVLIVRSGVTTREGAAKTCERFLNDGIPVLGTILNDWRPRDGSKLAEYYYAYGSPPPKKV
jgi:capsular exopolysaccharide synthesis family protein